MPLSDTKTGRERASGNAERHSWPGMQAAGEQPRRMAPPRAAFWLVAGVFCLMFFAAGARRRCTAFTRLSCGSRRSR